MSLGEVWGNIDATTNCCLFGYGQYLLGIIQFLRGKSRRNENPDLAKALVQKSKRHACKKIAVDKKRRGWGSGDIS